MQTVSLSLEKLLKQSTCKLNKMLHHSSTSPFDLEEFVQIRRDIHKNPELGFDEYRTAKLVTEKLIQLGYSVKAGLGKTGVVGSLKRGKSTKSIGLRADMDALPIHEESALKWRSEKNGVMHACGHDGHTATLLAGAKLIAEDLDFDGTVNLIFQPAEEGGGGALRMMEDDLFTLFPCDAVFAMHNMPGLEEGVLAFRDGPMMASSDYASIKIIGIGGHGAMPHVAADPIVAAASIIMGLQTIISRNVDPQQTAVITVGAVHSGQANNVIPASALLELSVRALDPKLRALLEQRIKQLVRAQADSYGVEAQITWTPGYSVLVNSKEQTDFARKVALEKFGLTKVELQTKALSASEDFAFMLERVPGCYFLIGNGDGDSVGACMVHNPQYEFSESIITTGAIFWKALVKEFLK